MNTSTKTATVRARIEPQVKAHAEKILGAIGLSTSDAINVFYRRIVAERGLPFSLHIPNRETSSVVRATRKGKDVLKFASFEDWEKSL